MFENSRQTQLALGNVGESEDRVMFEISRLTRLELGYVGETQSRVIRIDVRKWLKMWPKAIITIWVMRPDKNGYYAATETNDGILTWTVTAGDVAFAGDGLAQVKALDPHGSGAVYKSRTVGTKIYASLEEMTSDPDAPDPMEAWANQAASYKADAEKARDEAVRARDDTVEAAIISAPPIIGEAKGKVVTISKAAERLAQSVVSTISVQQTGTGTPSESNLRPIVTASNLALYHGVAYDETAAPAYTMELPEGVYGGRYDWVSGKLEITYGVIRLAGSDRTWQLGFGNNYTAIPGRAEKATLYSDRYVQIANPEGIKPGEMALGARNNNVCFGTDLSLEDWKAKLDAQPLEVVYELAEPVVVQLESTRIVMLDGDNALWSDTGDTEVAYIVDTKEYVDSVAGKGDDAVQSVNGKVGKVTLTAADVGALDKDAEIVDVEARKGVDALSEEKVDKAQGTDNALKLLFVADDGNISTVSAESGVEVQMKGDETDESIIVNLWKPDNYELGSFSNAGNKYAGDGTAMRSAEWIEVTPGAEYSAYFIKQPQLGMSLFFYDADGNFLEKKWAGGTLYHFAATGIKYVNFVVSSWYAKHPDDGVLPQMMLWRTTSTDLHEF